MASVARLVYVSSSEVYGTARVAPMTESHPLEPTTIYGASKLTGLLGREPVGVRFEPRRPGDVKRHYADVEKARSLFGYAPRVDLEDGLARTVAWFRENRIAGRAADDASGTPNW